VKDRTCETCGHTDTADEIEFLPGGFVGNDYHCAAHIDRTEANSEEFDETDSENGEEEDEPPYVETKENVEGNIAFLQQHFRLSPHRFESAEGQQFKAGIEARLYALTHRLNSAHQSDYDAMVKECRGIEKEMWPWLHPNSN